MFEYMTVQDAAKLWEISERRIQKLCEENRIDGVVRLSRVWLIPKSAQKPIDKRLKSYSPHIRLIRGAISQVKMLFLSQRNKGGILKWIKLQ